MDYDEYFDEDEKAFEDGYEQEDQYKAEIGAIDRVGPSGKLAEMLSTPYTDGPKKVENMSSEDRFLVFVDATCRRMIQEHIGGLSQSDIDTMLEKSKYVIGLRYKNPIAYIMGFLASKGGQSLKKDNVLMVINKVLPKMEGEGGVTPPDVIRYARYWKEHL
jgi:hypothetical protein